MPSHHRSLFPLRSIVMCRNIGKHNHRYARNAFFVYMKAVAIGFPFYVISLLQCKYANFQLLFALKCFGRSFS